MTLIIPGDTVKTIRTPDQRLRIFVSSTLQPELEAERVAVRDAIAELRQTPVMFESGARPHPPRALYQQMLEQCDIFIGIYWQKGGQLVPETTFSGIEEEYELSTGKLRLIYIKMPAPKQEKRLKDLIKRIRDGGDVAYKKFTSVEELHDLVANDLALALAERFGRVQSAPESLAPTALPRYATPFVGREQMIDRVVGHLRRDDVRLLTLTGTGGVGKTRLALEAGHRVENDFAEGAVFVDLAPLSDPALVAPAILQAVGLRDDSERPPVERLRDYLAEKQLLLLLDNFEHVLGAAPVVSTLLAHSPRLKILVTSRAPLRIDGEQEQRVDPMDLPDLSEASSLIQLEQMDAITLFVRRAQAIRAEFTLNESNARSVAEICVRLDGLPLAVELAAARTRLFPEPATLLAHLKRPLPLLVGGRRDAPARQQTLRNAIQWSHDLLTPDEQMLFRRLTVFAGGASVEAVKEICDAGHGIDILAGLTDLIEQGLVRSTEGPDAEPRFDMLQMVREYALERLEANDDATMVQQRHAAWCLALAEQSEASARKTAYGQWLDRLEVEHDNVRAALEWSLAQPDGEFSLRLAATMRPFWQTRGYLREGFQWLERALAKGEAATPETRAMALFDIGRLAFDLGDYAHAPGWFEASLELRRELDDKPGIVESLTNLELAVAARGQYARARMLLEEARTISHALGDTHGVASSLYRLGDLAIDEGDPARAHALYLESLEMMQGQDDSLFIANLHLMLGVAARLEGDGDAATRSVNNSLSLFGRVGDKMGTANARLELGHASRLLGNDEQSEQSYAGALILFQGLGSRPGMIEGLEGLAGIAAAHGHPERAAILVGAASAWRTILEHPFAPPVDRFAKEDLVGYAKREQAAAFTAGQDMSLEQAVEIGLADLTFPNASPSSS